MSPSRLAAPLVDPGEPPRPERPISPRDVMITLTSWLVLGVLIVQGSMALLSEGQQPSGPAAAAANQGFEPNPTSSLLKPRPSDAPEDGVLPLDSIASGTMQTLLATSTANASAAYEADQSPALNLLGLIQVGGLIEDGSRARERRTRCIEDSRWIPAMKPLNGAQFQPPMELMHRGPLALPSPAQTGGGPRPD